MNHLSELTDCNKLMFSILDYTDVGILIFDAYRNIVYRNKIAEDFLKDLNCEFYIVNNIFKDEEDQSIGAIDILDLFEAVIRIKKNDEDFYFRMKKFYAFGENNESYSVIIGRDITKEVFLLRRIHEMENIIAVSELTAAIVHEIKNSLTTVGGFVQLLKMRNIVDDSCFHFINDELNRICEIVKEFLQLTKAKGKKMNYINLNDVVLQLLTILDSEFTSKNITTGRKLNEIPRIKGDEKHFKQIILNLIKNSIEAMDKENGKIYILTRYNEKENAVLLKVFDNGTGIPLKNRKKIFDPLFTTKENGTGFGLFVIERIVKEYSGDVYVRSKPGKGSVFTIKIPVNMKKEDEEYED